MQIEIEIMLNLEQSIAQWRQHMLASGISASVLDELESHLREEIGESKKSGSSEEAAFNAGVREIGRGELLTREFNKAHSNDAMELAMNSLVQIIGWVAAAAILLLGVLQLCANRIPFQPLFIMLAVCKILVAEAGFWFLAKANRERTSLIVSSLVCVFLGWIGVVHGLWHSTPLWFCWSVTLVLMMPGVLWISRRLQSRLKEQNPITPPMIVAERIFSVTAAFYVILNSVWFLHTEATRPVRPVAMRLVIEGAYLLVFLLIIYAGWLTYNCLGTLRQARR